MGRKDVRRMLMGHKRPLWERPWVLVALMVGVLGLGLAVGVGVGRWSGKGKPAGAPVVMEQAPAPVFTPASPRDEPANDEADDSRPLIQPPPPRPDPGSSEALELGHASDVASMPPPPSAAAQGGGDGVGEGPGGRAATHWSGAAAEGTRKGARPGRTGRVEAR